MSDGTFLRVYTDETSLQWEFKVGDRFRRDDTLVKIKFETHTLVVPAPCDGVVAKIVHREGDRVLEDNVLALIDEEASQ